jgi:hypothetical protein
MLNTSSHSLFTAGSSQVRFSTHCMLGGFQVAVHLPIRTLELMTDHQKQLLGTCVLGEPTQKRATAKDSAVLRCIEELIHAGVLDSTFKPVEPPDIEVCSRFLPPAFHCPCSDSSSLLI